jgi:hypothetical protein
MNDSLYEFLKQEGINDPVIEEAVASIEDRFLELMNKPV